MDTDTDLDQFFTTWLAENVRGDENGQVLLRDLFPGNRVVTKHKFGSLLLRLFPGVKRHKKRVSGRLETLYKGISKVEKGNTAPETADCPLEEVLKYIPRDVMVQSSEKGLITLMMGSSLFLNGNMVMKTIKLSHTKWELWVRGCQVDLTPLHVDCSFTPSKECVLGIMDTVRKMSLCRGFPCDKSIIGENNRYLIEKLGNGNESEILVAHALSCKQVNSWTSSSGVCESCGGLFRVKKCLVARRKKKEKDKIEREKLLSHFFPNAPDEVKELLIEPQDVLATKMKCTRRYDKGILSVCHSLRVQSPRAYEDLRDSNIFVLPCRRQLQRFKNGVYKHQDPKVQGPKVHDPKDQGPKVHDPKDQGPKVRDPKVQGPKVHDPKVHDPKVHDPKVHDPKVHDPKVHDPKVHDPKVHDPKVHDPKVHDPKVHDPKVHDPKVHDPKVQGPKDQVPKGQGLQTDV